MSADRPRRQASAETGDAEAAAPSGDGAWPERDPADQSPLAGLRVLDFSELLPGPFLTQQLVELGADVLKVERPPHGDNVRHLSPALFEAVNRGKRSLRIDLRTDTGRAEARALARGADVLVESYRPGTLAKYGLDHAGLAADCPRLVYLSLSGYGQTGPLAAEPGHDLNYLAAAGVLSLAGDGGPPGPMPVPIADLGGAMLGLGALLAALLQRERSGRGQFLDVSLTEAMAHWMTPRLATLRGPVQATPLDRRQALVRAGYGSFPCADGALLTLGAIETPFFARLVEVLDLQAFAGADWQSPAVRAAHAPRINAAIAAALAALPSAEAAARLRAADVPVMEIATPDTLHAQPQHAARGLFVDTASGPLPRFPVRLNGMPPTPREAPTLDAGRLAAPPSLDGR